MNIIKNCPKCGAEGNIARWFPISPELTRVNYSVCCLNCKYETNLHRAKKNAIKEWNARKEHK